MRICSPQLGISPKSIFGGEIYDREILKELAKLGFAIDIILPQGKQFEKIKNWQITHVPIKHIVPPHLYNALIVPYLFQIYRKRPFEMLRVHAPTFVGLGAAIFQKYYPNIPLVGIYHFLGEGGWVEKYLDPYLIKKFTLIITDSINMKKKIIEKFPHAREKIFSIYNGVDKNLKPGLKDKSVISRYNLQNRTILLFMGLFIDRKNPLFLVEVLQKLVKQTPQVCLFLCGAGHLERKLRLKISSFSLEKHVILHPPVFGDKKLRLMNTADIFVHPAKEEGFSLAVIEAMAVGLPIVITKAFSASEAVIEGKNGYLAQPNNVDEWVGKILSLINNESKRKKMALYGINEVKEKFTWELAAKKTASLLHSIKNK